MIYLCRILYPLHFKKLLKKPYGNLKQEQTSARALSILGVKKYQINYQINY